MTDTPLNQLARANDNDNYERLRKVADTTKYWLETDHGMKVLALVDTPCSTAHSIDLPILDDEDEPFYVGNFADPGLTLSDLRNIGEEGKEDWIVKANGVWISATGRNIAAWVVGLV